MPIFLSWTEFKFDSVQTQIEFHAEVFELKNKQYQEKFQGNFS